MAPDPTSSGWRSEPVGSLLRPPSLVALRMALLRGQGDPAALEAAEDEAVLAALRRQEALGLDVVTDGEFRRFSFLGDVTDAVEGFGPGEMRTPDWFTAEGTANPGTRAMVVKGPLRPRGRMAGREAAFLLEHARRPCKITVPSPLVVAQSTYLPGVSDAHYPTRTDLLWALADLLKAEIEALAAQGVPYVQVDNPGLAYYLDPELRQRSEEAGIVVDVPLSEAVAADNHCLSGLEPGAVTVGLHVCRGNWQSAWLARGGYEPVAEALFSMPRVDRYVLEYDTGRAGGFEPLAGLPPGRTAVLGLVSTKHGRLEDRGDIQARLREAAEHVGLDRLALSPQCGFATSIPGNDITEDEQWAKLGLVAGIAAEVWKR